MSDQTEPIDDDLEDLDELDDDRTPIGLLFRWAPGKGLDEREVSLLFSDLGPGDDLACRREVKLPVTAFLGDFGSDSLVVLWWTARRKARERNLTYRKVERQSGSLASIGSKLHVEPIFEDDESEGEDPEL